MEWTRRTVVFGRSLVIAGVLAIGVGLVLVERVSQTYEDGLDATAASAVLVRDAVDPLSMLATDLGALADELAAGLDVARGVLVSTSGALDRTGEAAATNLSEMAAGAAGISDDLAGVIEAIERLIPGDSDSLAEDLRRLADGLDPLSDQLVELGALLDTTATQLGDADATLAELAGRIDAIVAGIERLAPTFDALALTASDVEERADAAADRLALDRWLLRLLVLVGGLVVALLGVVVERFAIRLGDVDRAHPVPDPGMSSDPM